MAELHRVRLWAEALIQLHLDESWSFDFDNAKRRAGLCSYRNKRISVSRYLAARFDDDEIHQILLHEVAHALAGPRVGHGAKWLHTARELGYVGGVTHNGETAHELAPWVGTCPSGHHVYRYRRPTRSVSCTKCATGYDRRFRFRWEHREVTPEMRREALRQR